MQPPRLAFQALTLQRLCHSGSKGNDVVLHLGFDLLNAGNGEACLGRDRFGRVGGDDTALGQHRARCGFHLQPAAVFCFLGPDAAHGRACVTFDQRVAPWPAREACLSATPIGPISIVRKICIGKPPAARYQPALRPVEANGNLDPANSQPHLQFIQKQAAPRFVGLEPLSVDDQLRNRALANVANHFGRGSRICIHVDLCVFDPVRIEKLLGGPAIPAPARGIDLHLHVHILAGPAASIGA